jgi:hypothetical protein
MLNFSGPVDPLVRNATARIKQGQHFMAFVQQCLRKLTEEDAKAVCTRNDLKNAHYFEKRKEESGKLETLTEVCRRGRSKRGN